MKILCVLNLIVLGCLPQRKRSRVAIQKPFSTCGLEPAPTELSEFNCTRYGSEETLYLVVRCLQPFSDSFNGEYYPHTWPQGLGTATMEFFDSL
jgi:hypothetical protein